MNAAVELSPSSLDVHVATLHGIPVYDGDLEAESGIPDPVSRLKDQIADADAILLATPEYNSSLPGPLKNAIDWCTRPPSDMARVFGGKPLALMGATPGGWGTKLSQAAWLPIFRSLDVVPWVGGQLYVAKAGDVFRDGQLVDDGVRQKVSGFMTGFETFIRAHRSDES